MTDSYSTQIDDLEADRSLAQQRTVGWIDADPDKAARALDLASSTGVPPQAILSDMPSFERDHKARLASAIVAGNPRVSQYLATSEMAPQISNDDYWNLTEVDRHVQRVQQRGFLSEFTDAIHDSGLFERAGAWAMRNPEQIAWAKDNPNAFAALTAVFGPFETAMQLVGAAINVIAYEGGEAYRQLVDAEEGSQTGKAGRAIAAAVQDPGLQASIPGMTLLSPLSFFRPSRAQMLRTPQDVTTFPERRGGRPLPDVVMTKADAQQYNAALYQMMEPWLRDKIPPPRGLNATLDRIKAQDNEMRVERLGDLLVAANKSATKERSPEAFNEFLRLYPEARIAIDGDAAAALYPEGKVPLPDDGILGWVPNIAEKLRAAREHGGEVEIPLGEWTTRVDPIVFDALRDNIRVDPGGVTKAEADKAALRTEEAGKLLEAEGAKVEGAPPAPPRPTAQEAHLHPNQPSPHLYDNLQTLAALEPKYHMEGKLTLKRKLTPESRFFTEEDFRTYEVLDEAQRLAGYMVVSVQDSKLVPGRKMVYIEDTASTNVRGGEAGAFGHTAMMGLIRQLKQEFPHTATFGGLRVSGARLKAGAVDTHGLIEVKWDNPAGWAEAGEMLREPLEGGTWMDLPGGRQAYIKPTVLFAPEEAKLAEQVKAELTRLIPEGARPEAFPAQRLVKGEREPRGVYFRDPMDQAVRHLLIWSLENPDAVGTIRHEAIHILKGEGFFTAAEWASLEGFAVRQGWLEKYNIHTRYATLDDLGKLEEAIAEGFRDWRRGGAVPEGIIAQAFARLAELLDTIRVRIKETFGRDLTAEELFDMVERGQLGRREEAVGRDQWGFRPPLETMADAAKREGYLRDPDGQPTIFHPKGEGVYTTAGGDGPGVYLRGGERLPNGEVRAPTEVLPRFTGKEMAAPDLRSVYDRLRAEQGVSFVPIHRLIAEMGLPPEVIHEVLLGEAREGRATLAGSNSIGLIEEAKAAGYTGLKLEDRDTPVFAVELSDEALRRTTAGEAKPRLRPAIRTEDGEVHVGQITHEDVPLPHGPRTSDFSGWVTPDGQFLNKEDSLKWVERNDPTIGKEVRGYGSELDAEQYSYYKTYPPEPQPMEAMAAALPPRQRGFARPSAPEGQPITRRGITAKEMAEPLIREEHGGQLRLEDLTRMEDRLPFDRAKALGILEPMYRRIIKLMGQKQIDEVAAIHEKAQKEVAQQHTDAWRNAERVVRAETVESFNNRPQWAAENLYERGILYGDALSERPRIPESALTPEQKAILPSHWVARTGMHVDDAAQLMGFPSGAMMLDALTALVQQRATMRPDAFRRAAITAEVQARMAREHGDLQANILEQTTDRVLADSQLELLHQDILAAGMKAGLQFSLTLDDMRAMAKAKIEESAWGHHTVQKLLNASGKAGRDALDAALKGDYHGAFLETQRQALSVHMAREMAKVEKANAKFEKLATRYQAREVPRRDQAFTNHIQTLLYRAGVPMRRTPEELADAIAREGRQGRPGTLPDFVAQARADGWELKVADWMINDPKTLDRMTVGERMDFANAITSLDHAGRENNRVIIAGEAARYNDVKADIAAALRQRPELPRQSPRGKLRFHADASLTRPETLIEALDFRGELGPLFQAVWQPLVEAKYLSNEFQDKLAAAFLKMKGTGKEWMDSLADKVPNNFLQDYHFTDGRFHDLNRSKMINIMLNFGNRSNIEKFTRGAIDPNLRGVAARLEAQNLEAKLWQLFDQHATKQDWDFAQNIWDTFASLQPHMREMEYRVSGVPSVYIDAQRFQTRHGGYAGGYFPVFYDPLMGPTPQTPVTTGILGKNYHRSTTPHGHLNERKDYFAPLRIEDTMDLIASRLTQEIHDFTHREAVMQADKFIRDKDIQALIIKHYGIEYAPQLRKWLEAVANQYNVDEQTISAANRLMRALRLNLSPHVLGFNPKIILSPAPGRITPAEITRYMQDWERNDQIVYDRSREIPHTYRNSERDIRDLIDATVTREGWKGVRAQAAYASMWLTLKTEMGARKVTFLTAYDDALLRGLSEPDAIALADAKVRTLHGSAAPMDLPAVMRGPESQKLWTLFYTYFNLVYNQQRRIRESATKFKDPGEVFGDLWSTVIFGSIVGYAFFTQFKEDDPMYKRIGKTIGAQVAGTVPLGRDIATFFMEGHLPTTPLGGMAKALGQLSNDTMKIIEGKAFEQTKLIKSTANVIGMSTGLPLAQVGRTGQFLGDTYTGRQAPQNILEWIRGIIHGEAQLKRR